LRTGAPFIFPKEEKMADAKHFAVKQKAGLVVNVVAPGNVSHENLPRGVAFRGELDNPVGAPPTPVTLQVAPSTNDKPQDQEAGEVPGLMSEEGQEEEEAEGGAEFMAALGEATDPAKQAVNAAKEATNTAKKAKGAAKEATDAAKDAVKTAKKATDAAKEAKEETDNAPAPKENLTDAQTGVSRQKALPDAALDAAMDAQDQEEIDPDKIDKPGGA
jgi:hypothetical protein